MCPSRSHPVAPTGPMSVPLGPTTGRVQRGLLKAYGALSRRPFFAHPMAQQLYARVYFFYKRRTEGPLLDALAGTVEPGSVVIDVGAHVGFHAVHFAQRVGDEGQVIAFEPDSRNVDLLRWSLARHRRTNVRVVEAALADEDGIGTLFLNGAHPADHRIFESDGPRMRRSIPLATLDHYLDETALASRVSMIKLDVQGAEMKVLRGAARTLARHPVKALLVEFAPALLRAAGDSPELLADFLRSAGYRPQLFDRDTRGFAPAAWHAVLASTDRTSYADVLCTRP